LISDVEKPITAPPQWPASNTVDETDLKLIHGLVADGRASFTELASTVGLSHAAVRDRVLRLLGGALVVRAVPGPGATDHLAWAGLLIKISAEAAKIAASLAERPELTLVAVSAGRFGVVCEARAEDLDDLHRLTEWVRGVAGVDSIEALHYAEIVKQDFEGGGI
jgi:Lrp/AsnC family transcriptional regulator for asnA, asnC and gidA